MIGDAEYIPTDVRKSQAELQASSDRLYSLELIYQASMPKRAAEGPNLHLLSHSVRDLAYDLPVLHLISRTRLNMCQLGISESNR